MRKRPRKPVRRHPERDPSSPYMTVPEAAAYLRVSSKTLSNLRVTGKGPRFRRHAAHAAITYHRDDLDEFSNRNTYHSTSDKREDVAAAH